VRLRRSCGCRVRPCDALVFLGPGAQNGSVRRYVAPLALVACTLATPHAHAAGGSDTIAHARALGEEAADLLDAKSYAAALDRASHAEALFHAPTNLLMVAQAQEGLGLLAGAMETYGRLAAEKLPPTAPRAFVLAVATANTRLRDLDARVPSVLVKVAGPAAGSMTATVDGNPLPLRANAPVRLDAGPHALRLTAPGFKPFERSLTLTDRSGVTVVEASFEPLGDHPDAIGTLGPSPPDAGRHGRRPLAPFVAFGAGAVGFVVGAVAGIDSLSKVSGLGSRCPGHVCAPSEQPTINSATSLGTVSNIGIGVGIAGLATGIVLLVLRPTEGASPPRETGEPTGRRGPTVTPWVGIGAAGASGSF